MARSAQVIRCPSCGAAVDPRAEICTYCRSPLVWRAPGAAAGLSRQEVFARIKAAPAYRRRGDELRANELALAEAQRQIGRINPLHLGLFIGAVGISLLALLFGLLFVPMLFAAAWWLYRLITGAPPLISGHMTLDGQPTAALVIGKRTQVYGTGQSITTRYFVTVELEDRSRHELETQAPTTYADLSEGDAGVIFTDRRRTKLAFFDRVPLDG
ncbi:MAG: hypothetical protein OHK0022_05250 [Roseiflexaceae bacterium]